MKNTKTHTHTYYQAHPLLAENIIGRLNILLDLIKFKITILVSFTTALGYLLASNSITLNLFYPIIGIFLLACSASALNHFLESETDALMTRTKNRPIPSGRILKEHVLTISALLLIAGSLILIYFTNITTLIIGLFTFLWYNCIYTPLKKKSSLAVIPGALVGALPPLAGWTAAGGNVFNNRILIIAVYFFIWQIPHFWLLLMIYGDDYKTAGFPVLSDVFNKIQLKRITFMWLIAAVFTAMLIPLFGNVQSPISYFILFTLCGLMFFYSFKFYFSDANNKTVIRTFLRINFFTMSLITLLIADKILHL